MTEVQKDLSPELEKFELPSIIRPMPAIGSNLYTAEYFLSGKQVGISNYENYRFLPILTTAYAQHLMKHLSLEEGDSIHDIGCAMGFLVKVLNDLGFRATGHDISEWAIQNCHQDVKGLVSLECKYQPNSVDWIHAKDCLEHWDDAELKTMLPKIFTMARKGCFFIVPLVAYWGGKYLYPADNLDKTHRIRITLESWMRMLQDAAGDTAGNFTISGSFHMHGLKKASLEYPHSTGFFVVRRFLP